MKYQWVFCVLLAVFASSAFALDCYVCESKEQDNACGKMGLEFDPSGEGITVETCEEPGKNETGEAVCGKTITTYQSKSNPDNNGVIAARFCDIVDHEDECTEDYGGNTETFNCVCRNEDKCNAAVATSVVSMLTLAVAALVAML